jgi:hypothetical protein
MDVTNEALENPSAMAKSTSSIPPQATLTNMLKRKEDRDKHLALGGAGDRPSAKKRRVVESEPEEEEESDGGVVGATLHEKEDAEDVVESDEELEDQPNVTSKRCVISS